MPRTKISEFSATPASNTDIDSIFIGEGMAPSNVNDAIRELMAQLKDFQTGAVGDSFNGPIGSTTAATGAFTTLTTTGTINNLTVGRGAGAISTNTAVGASALAANVNGYGNAAIGYNALLSTTDGYSNAGVGREALRSNTTGANNVAVGREALYSNTTASNNTAVGYQAGYSNTTAVGLTAVGFQTLYSNQTGTSYNTGLGFQAGYSNTTGAYNVFIGGYDVTGYSAGFSNTTGASNVALGNGALSRNTTASNNTAVGYQAGYSNVTGFYQTFVGTQAGYSTTTGDNSAFGYRALYLNTTGTLNSAIGELSLTANTTGSYNTAVGVQALQANTTASYNTALGYQAGYAVTTGVTNCFIGYGTATAATTGSRNVSVGDRRLEGQDIFNLTTENDRAIFGHNSITNAYVKVAWTVTSDARDKTDVQPMTHGLAFVQQLNPVSYRWKTSREDATPVGTKRYGFLAQDILALEGKDNVIIDNEQANHLKYQGEALVPVLVKAIQELKAEFDAYKALHP